MFHNWDDANLTDSEAHKLALQRWRMVTETGRSLVAKWRREARERGFDRWTAEHCAEELEALIQSSQPDI